MQNQDLNNIYSRALIAINSKAKTKPTLKELKDDITLVSVACKELIKTIESKSLSVDNSKQWIWQFDKITKKTSKIYPLGQISIAFLKEYKHLKSILSEDVEFKIK